MSRELWREWLHKCPISDRDRVCEAAIERLIELEEVAFRIDDIVDENGKDIPDDVTLEQCLYWTSCGEDLRG